MGVEMRANSEERAKAALDVFKDKLVKRKVSLKHLETGDPAASGKEYRIAGTLSARASPRRTPRRSPRSSGTKARRASSHRFRATSCGSPAKAATTCRRSNACSNGKDLDVALQYVNYR